VTQEAEFPAGLLVKAPHEKAPDFVKLRISIKRQELIDWLSSKDEDWINLDVKEARSGKLYAAVDQYKPQSGGSSGSRGGAPQRQRQAPASRQPDRFDPDEFGDSIPFATNRSIW